MRVVRKIKAIYHKVQFIFRKRYWRRIPPVKTIMNCYWGSRPKPFHKKLCLFSTFDAKGRIDSYVKEYVRNLSQCGFDVVIISTSPAVSQRDVDDLKQVCRAILHRRNVGIDFGSWKAAMDYLPDWQSYEGMLLTNDSVYGPFTDLRPIFQMIDEAEEKVCGLTDSFEASYHIQSYFLYVKQELMRSDVFQSFLEICSTPSR